MEANSSLVYLGSEMEDYSLDNSYIVLTGGLAQERTCSNLQNTFWKSGSINVSCDRARVPLLQHNCVFASSKASLRLPTSTNTLQLVVVSIIFLIASQCGKGRGWQMPHPYRGERGRSWRIARDIPFS